MKALSKEIQEEIVRLYDSGLSVRRIEGEVEVSNWSIEKYLKLHGRSLLSVEDRRSLKKKDIIKAEKLYKEGKSLTDLSKIFNCSLTTISDTFKKNGLQSRGNKDIYGNDYNKVHSCNDSFFEKIDSERKAYWLGYMFADGCNHEKDRAISFGQTEQYKDAVYQFKTDIKGTQTISIGKPRISTFRDKEYLTATFYRIMIRSKQLSEDLARHGCTKNKTLTTTFPDIPHELRRHFIRGYFDGDGSVTSPKTKNSSIQFNMIGTFELLKVIQENIVENTELNATKISAARKGSPVGMLIYGGINNCRHFYDYIYEDSTVCLEKKKEKFESILKLYKDRDDKKDKISNKKNEEILKLYNEGYSFRQIALMLHTSRSRISEVVSQSKTT